MIQFSYSWVYPCRSKTTLRQIKAVRMGGTRNPIKTTEMTLISIISQIQVSRRS